MLSNDPKVAVVELQEHSIKCHDTIMKLIHECDVSSYAETELSKMIIEYGIINYRQGKLEGANG